MLCLVGDCQRERDGATRLVRAFHLVTLGATNAGMTDLMTPFLALPAARRGVATSILRGFEFGGAIVSAPESRGVF